MLAGSIGQRRAGVAARLRAWLAAGVALARVALQAKLVYRFNLVVGFASTIVVVQIMRQLWMAIYSSGAQGSVAVGKEQAITYSAMSMLMIPLFSNSIIFEQEWRIYTGNVVFDLTRPMYYGDQLLFGFVGRSLASLLTNTAPTLALIALTMPLTLPAGGWLWPAFFLSVAMGLLINFLLDYLMVLFAFWATQAGGMANFKSVLSQILGGWYVPLWIFPPAARQVVLALPFAGISYTPLALFVGAIEPAGVPGALALQLVWIAALVVITRLLYRAVVRKLSVQGG